MAAAPPGELKMNYPSSPSARRLLGIVITGTAIFGFLLSILGIFFIWSIKTSFSGRITSNLDLAKSILTTTSDGLDAIGDSLGSLSGIISTLESTLGTFGESLVDADPLVTEIRTLVGDQIPTTLEATRTSIESAQSSAGIVESVLRSITSIPFFPGDPYAPEVPLEQALGDVADRLGDIPSSLQEAEQGLASIQENIGVTQGNLSSLSGDIGDLKSQLDDAELVIVSYQGIARDLSEKLDNLSVSIPKWINLAAIVLTTVFLWVIFTQIGLLIQGIGLFKSV
jgi:ABC-type transporter Mla subunit MlaD